MMGMNASREEVSLLLVMYKFHALFSEYAEAVQLYTKALELYPPLSDHEASVCFANRAACFMKMVSSVT